MHPCVVGEFRVEGGNQMITLFHKNRISMILGEHLYSGPRAPDDGGANENGFNVARPGALDESLLGMSFLGRLKSYAVERGRLVLTAR